MELSERDIEQGYWYYRPEEQFPPKSIMFPYEYDGDHRLNVICTQTDLSARRQKKLVKEWCQTFPKLENVKSLTESGSEFAVHIGNVFGTKDRWLLSLRRYGQKMFGRKKPPISDAESLLLGIKQILESEPSISDLKWLLEN